MPPKSNVKEGTSTSQKSPSIIQKLPKPQKSALPPSKHISVSVIKKTEEKLARKESSDDDVIIIE